MKLFDRDIGGTNRLFLIAGPCVLESRDLALRIGEELRAIADRHHLLVIFKGSFDKANRTSIASYRGPGMDEGLRILDEVRAATGLPTITDVHEPGQIAAVSASVDMLQTPAFLARQTDLILAAARSGRPVNFKKAQYMAPADMANVLEKARTAAREAVLPDDRFLLCERGTSFGYNTLVNDMRGLAIMAETGAPVVFDATHSVQKPGSAGNASGGERQFVPVLARAAVAAGVGGLFLETHPEPDKALSDGPNAWPLDQLELLIAGLLRIDEATKEIFIDSRLEHSPSRP
ncbi:MAG: 3-deoxy-8-phosphooctulonate synthase [Sphingobium sp.]|nr:3-deoxy-8-phosphooctulonate synthase [Sphingobium sp.]